MGLVVPELSRSLESWLGQDLRLTVVGIFIAKDLLKFLGGPGHDQALNTILILRPTRSAVTAKPDKLALLFGDSFNNIIYNGYALEIPAIAKIHLTLDMQATPIAATIVALAESLKLKVIAEGVETEEQRLVLPESVRPAPGSTSNPLTCMAI